MQVVVHYHPNVSILRLKERFVAKGYAQTYGVNYFKTFSRTTKLKLLQVSISVAINPNWQLYPFDS